ncbi:hypothetical protein [Sporosarcina obsidiansis]|uniref:hypothetical protein n=1 Tax=Sporosarcina obsidiansis TaxID=2660748 RepID=UPI00129AD1DD|nr:hypothetical protein [Sporosarcina obsidiansis]
MTNQIAEQKQTYSTALTKISNTFFPMIEQQLTGNGLNMDHYAKQCVMSAISTINAVLDSKNISWSDPQLDKSNVTQNLLTVASLKLNSAANPREVYFQMRNVKRKVDGRDVWTKQIEMGIEGDGNDAILSNFGRGVKEVHQYWLVRSEDKFEYPKFKGIEMSPPEWEPTGRGEVVRVVYPITKASGQVEYHITEREDVSRNLIAHINNNLMNETFGIAESRFKATAKQKGEIDAKKREILKKVQELGMAALDDEDLQQYISPAWKDPQSRESMIIRKMRNNIVKKIPKDFGNAFVEMTYDQAEDESFAKHMGEVRQHANQELLDIEPEEQPAEKTNNQREFVDAEYSDVNAPEFDAETGEVKNEPEEVPVTAAPEESGQADLFGNGPGF